MMLATMTIRLVRDIPRRRAREEPPRCCCDGLRAGARRRDEDVDVRVRAARPVFAVAFFCVLAAAISAQSVV